MLTLIYFQAKEKITKRNFLVIFSFSVLFLKFNYLENGGIVSDILFYFSNLYAGDNSKVYQAIKSGQKINDQVLNEQKQKYNIQNISYLTMVDYYYPTNLILSKQPPFVVYYKGNPQILKNNHIKVYLVNEVYTNFTQKYILDNIKQLVENTTLVTNGYKYTEQELIKLYRKNGGKIIHIAKSGIDYFRLDMINFENEIVISKYPLECNIEYENFKNDNYLASLLADQLIYFSSKEKSKTHHLVNYFLEHGKDVFCFPGYGLNDGNNQLIKNGAKLITYIAETIQI